MVSEKSISRTGRTGRGRFAGGSSAAVGKEPVELRSDRDSRGGCRYMSLGFDGVGDYLGEVFHVLFGGIEGAHPADDAFFFNPHVEKVAGFDFFDGMAWDLNEYSVGFDLPDDLYLRDEADFLFQQASHAIGVFGAAAPEVVREQSFELHGDEAHF